MRKLGLIVATLAFAVLTAGCETKEETRTLWGASTGALIGSSFGHDPGSVAGMLGGGFIGNCIGKSMDDEDRRRAIGAQYSGQTFLNQDCD